MARAILQVRPPFRLDYTVMALRRLPTYPVGTLVEGTRYLRAFATSAGPVVWEVVSKDASHLELRLYGAARDPAPWRALAARMLGTKVDLGEFYRRARRLPRVAELVAEFRGLKPPRFADLMEAVVNTVSFQQLSLPAAMTLVRRLVERFARPVWFAGLALYPLPDPGLLAAADDAEVRSLGFSLAKARAIRGLAGKIAAGELSEAALEALPTPQAMRLLQAQRGIGAWTAGLLLLRGLRRLEVFPGGDVGAQRGLRGLLGDAAPEATLEALGPYRGMLYYHLLLARLRDATRSDAT